ncbi:carboxylesterase [Sphaerisporangium melleum]|uniref:Carboxylesterase n=1 Tax=Sphaerisporangium melleum TaxID=321316 RepID=A0A917QWW7_9ACTN|nr:alpha/beta hydrolase [Sphaerisporangium melleum]GGK72386.1 carboxylesterase [Sphaerisporangium melleum]GII68346.1 carboxylesterase [Sphaerisporangium melleum]
MPRARVGRFVTPAAEAEFIRIYQEGLTALPPPTETRDVPTPFGRVRVHRFGEAGGPPLVLLHGRAATGIMWLPNLAAFAEHHTVYALDLLGEGGLSVQTAPITGPGDQAAWVTAVLDGIGVHTCHLVGVSIGGWLACNQAIRTPARVASLTLLDPAATLGRVPVGVVLRTIPAALPFTAAWGLPAFLRWVNGGDPVPHDDPVARVIIAGLRHYRTALPPPAYPADDDLRSITAPTLAVVAGRSVIHDPRKAYERAKALIPHVQPELWPHATHSIAGQCATEVNARVLAFVGSAGA